MKLMKQENNYLKMETLKEPWINILRLLKDNQKELNNISIEDFASLNLWIGKML
jgi:hypothetical protein